MNTSYLSDILSGRESFIQANCPKLYAMFKRETAAQLPLSASNKQAEEIATGFQDMTDIEDISYDPKSKVLKAQSVAGFRERKGVITIVSEVFDSLTGESITGSAVTTSDAYSLTCHLDCKVKGETLTKDSRFFIRSVFYWTETDSEGQVVMRSQEIRRDSGMIYSDETIVKNITVEFPNTLKPREYTVVLYNRQAETHIEDPDLIYPGITVINNKLPFYLPFKGSVSVGTGKIVGVDAGESVIRLQHPDKKTEVVFNKDQNWRDIKWIYLNDDRCLSWEFPENWKNNLDLKDLSVCSIFDFYARLLVKIKLGEGILTPIPITIGSKVEPDDIHCKIKQVFIQWGCLGEHTRITMADGSLKEIRNIKPGDRVATGKEQASVIDIYTGTEEKIICLKTETDKRLLLTDSHPVMTDNGWVRAYNLNAGMCVLTADGKLEKLKELYTIPYGKKVYNLQLDNHSSQLLAEGIVVGDFMQQNCMNQPGSKENCLQEVPIKGQEDIAEEFQILVDEINRQYKRN